MGKWHDENDYSVSEEVTVASLQEEAAPFWARLFERVTAEKQSMERVLFETAWDGPRFIAYAQEEGCGPGYDTGWRMQCFIPPIASTDELWFAFLCGSGKGTATKSYCALKKAHPQLAFWRSDYGDGSNEEKLPL